MDVAQDLASLTNHARHGGEVVLHEYEIGNRARDLRPGSLRDRQARLLQCGNVVDSVADHCHVASRLAQRANDGALAVRRDPPDGGRREDRLAQGRGLRRQRLAVQRRRRALDAHVAGDRAGGGRRVAGEDLERHLLVREERDGGGRVGA